MLVIITVIETILLLCACTLLPVLCPCAAACCLMRDPVPVLCVWWCVMWIMWGVVWWYGGGSVVVSFFVWLIGGWGLASFSTLF